MDRNDFLVFDKTYTERLHLRQSLNREYPSDVIGITNDSDPRVRLAVQELYSYLFETYLPSRYPSIFNACHDKTGSVISIENLVTKTTISKDTESISLHVALETISENVDEDFFILLPHRQKIGNASEDVVYVLEAYSACFPSGFQPREKIGKKLADIHGPVPRYKEKLQKSMDRYFARLEAGRLVKRVNWSLTVDEELFSNFDKSTPAFEGTLKKMTVDDLDLDKVCLFIFFCNSPVLSLIMSIDIPPLRAPDPSSSSGFRRYSFCFSHLSLSYPRCEGRRECRGPCIGN